MACLLDRQGAVNLHRTFDTLLKRRRDVDTDMRDVVICHDGISASSQNNKIFLLRHVNQKVALVEEDRITLRQSVETAELAHALAQGQMALRDECLTRVYIGILIVRRLFLDSRLDSVADRILYRILLSLETFQNRFKDLRVVEIDFQLICQLKSDIYTAASVGPADTYDQVVIFGETVFQVKCIQLRQLCVDNAKLVGRLMTSVRIRLYSVMTSFRSSLFSMVRAMFPIRAISLRTRLPCGRVSIR